ncbi:hypothetical protein A3C18_00115 [Candidatus Kaiserbacteria bacterium RIFCSPHIGHO2_02_FULL_54_11b]|uniref:Uncharacterized protein n=2 Tax=Candidatus Kaiseribacteriota TaxID=1752734 RepID=A0A1F6CRN6_9BACT|nr:MAG: hypothetical protein A2704_07035 [Candidatus Kaiserbacteria bacterium RIFCSPHIGHO2_01_FULL_54_36b]OGG64682.1 MAG: hypothetical protein A3C18_00115 [Candidatus Kaiserbacteria bacterium RIFCSPHIGHO2_02_FULL_54_11b]
MMTMSMTLITSRDPKGRQTMSIIEAAYDKAKLDDDSAQLLNERGDELKAGVSELIAKLSITNQYADEEVESSYGYLSGYDKPKSLQDQATILRKMFPELGECDFALGDKELPDGAEGPFAIPRWQKIGKTYGEALQKVLDELSKAYGGKFKNWREGQLGPNNLRQSAKSVGMWEKLGNEQQGDILVVPAQFGLRHRGRSVRRAREVMRKAEFGLGAFAVGIMLLTHMDRLQNVDDLWIDCAGDEFHDPQNSDAPFGLAPCFYFNGGQLRFGTEWSDDAIGNFGSASGWSVPQA